MQRVAIQSYVVLFCIIFVSSLCHIILINKQTKMFFMGRGGWGVFLLCFFVCFCFWFVYLFVFKINFQYTCISDITNDTITLTVRHNITQHICYKLSCKIITNTVLSYILNNVKYNRLNLEYSINFFLIFLCILIYARRCLGVADSHTILF